MVRRTFVLIKRKGAKRFLGAVPIRKGATLKGVRTQVRKQLSKKFGFKIVDMATLRKIILRQGKSRIRKRPIKRKVRRTIRRRKRR